MNRVVTYSQNREDVILEAMLKKVVKGFYVDIGANHPVNHSVTKLFYDKGWSGINIEPIRSVQESLNKFRPRDTNLQIGIGKKKSRMILREYDNLGLSTLSDEMKKHYESQGTNVEFLEYEVEVDTLSSVLDKYSPKNINFMKIDVEGAEYDVIVSNNWDKFRPDVLCIEANHIIKDWHGLLDKYGYLLVFNDGLNEYFVAKEQTKIIEDFDFPNDILVGNKVIIPHPIARELNEKDSLIKHLKISQASLMNKVKAQADIIRDQKALITNGAGIKYHSQMFIKAFLRRVRRTFRSKNEL